MGVFRFENKFAAPSKEQRERYMTGETEEHLFGPDNMIMLIVYDEAAYLKDDIDGVRILFTGVKDKEKIYDEVRRLIEYHQQPDENKDAFRAGNEV
jgi:hypothetical protein